MVMRKNKTLKKNYSNVSIKFFNLLHFRSIFMFKFFQYFILFYIPGRIPYQFHWSIYKKSSFFLPSLFFQLFCLSLPSLPTSYILLLPLLWMHCHISLQLFLFLHFKTKKYPGKCNYNFHSQDNYGLITYLFIREQFEGMWSLSTWIRNCRWNAVQWRGVKNGVRTFIHKRKHSIFIHI